MSDMQMARRLTDKQRAWLEAYLSLGSGAFLCATRAARLAYPDATPGSAAVIGYENRHRLKEYIDAWFEKEARARRQREEELLARRRRGYYRRVGLG